MKKILFSTVKPTLLTFILCFLTQPLFGAITTSRLFDTVKAACPSTNKNYHILAKVMLRNADNGRITDAARMAIKIDLARAAFYHQPQGEFTLYAETVLNYLNKDQDPDSTCNVCFEKPDDFLGAITCGHCFCYNCLFNWFTKQNSDNQETVQHKCPTCRTPIDLSSQIALLRDSRANSRIQRNHQQRHQAEQEREELLEQYLIAQILQVLLQNRDDED